MVPRCSGVGAMLELKDAAAAEEQPAVAETPGSQNMRAPETPVVPGEVSQGQQCMPRGWTLSRRSRRALLYTTAAGYWLSLVIILISLVNMWNSETANFTDLAVKLQHVVFLGLALLVLILLGIVLWLCGVKDKLFRPVFVSSWV